MFLIGFCVEQNTIFLFNFKLVTFELFHAVLSSSLDSHLSRKVSRRSMELSRPSMAHITLHHSHHFGALFPPGLEHQLDNKLFCVPRSGGMWFLSRWNYKLTITDAAKDGLEFMCLDRGENFLGFMSPRPSDRGRVRNFSSSSFPPSPSISMPF
jgi:hypothetical protein